MLTADVAIENHGSLMIFQLQTEAARDWVGENVAGDPQFWGPDGLVVEPRYAANLAAGMFNAGLVVA